ncbi:MAG: DUF4168 domain-containing protein [Heteroscytonema crispum UTEX LB 1556]
MLSKSLLLSFIATVGLLSSPLLLSSKANAQTPGINNNEIINYAQAVLGMEPARRQAFDEIKKIVGSREVPKIACSEPNSLNGLPGKARDIAVNYCQHSQQIVEQNGLSIDRFNSITVEVQNNDQLQQRIYRTLIRIQKNPNMR